jgi:adenosylcobinamide-phosphate synthase
VDCVIAPLICAFLFGPLGAFLYKAIDVLDSAFGHKNEQYYDFGRFAAWLDRVANWLPARITIWLMAVAAMLLGMRPLAALRVSRRDGATQENLNAALPEAAMAGALGIQLGGPVFRGGSFDPQPFMGDPVHRLEPGHIRQANALLFAMTILAATIFALLRKGLMVIL